MQFLWLSEWHITSVSGDDKALSEYIGLDSDDVNIRLTKWQETLVIDSDTKADETQGC